MRRNSNVLPFPSDPPSGRGLKAFAVIFYLVLALALANPDHFLSRDLFFPGFGHAPGLGNESLGFIVILGLLYGALVRHRSRVDSFMRGRKVAIYIIGLLILVSVWHYVPYLLLLGVAYYLLVARGGREVPYFLRFHLLTAMVLAGLTALPLLMLEAFLAMLGTLMGVLHAGILWLPVAAILTLVWPIAVLIFFWLPALWLSFCAVMGRTPEIPLVTQNVRHWA